MTLTRSRTIQYIGILLALGLIAAGYWYFAVRAGVKTNTTAGQQAGANDPANGLAAYWTFDENTGTSTTDSSVNGATGTLTNGPAWTTGQIGYALDFDGTNDYVTTPDADPLELALERSRFTIAGWFNRDTFTTDDTIIAKRNGITAADDGYVVYIDDATDQIIFEFSDGVDEYQLASTTTFTATGWHHFVVTQSPADGNLTMYIDGLPDSPTVTGNINDMEPAGNALAQRIGAESDGGNPFDGKIDEVRYYPTRSFTAEQVAELYRLQSRTGVDTSLKGYWSFDGMERGDYVYDQSGAANRGTPFGSGTLPAPTPAAGRVGQAMSFDGVDDYIGMGVSPSLTNIANMTVCIWANPTGATDGSLISKDDSATGWNVVGNSTGLNSVTFFKGWSGGVGYGEWRTADGTLPNNEWTQVCITYSNSSTTNDPIFYINGAAVSATEVNAPSGTVTDDSTFDAVIGSYGAGLGAFFDGRLDEARVYNRIFSASEVKNLYERGAPNQTNTGAVQAQGGADLAAGLALYWPLDEGTGTNADDKGVGQNDGTLTNGPAWTTGQIGSAVDFDGTNDYIAAADPASGILDFSTPSDNGNDDIWNVSIWFNRDTATTDDTLIAKKDDQTTGDGYIVWIDDATDKIYARAQSTTDTPDYSESYSTTTYTSTGWHHLVVEFNEYLGTAGFFQCPRIHVDGADVTDGTSCANYLHYTNDTMSSLAFAVGAESDGGNPFDGKLDDVRVYTRPLTTLDINQLYQLTATTTGIDTGLIGYWTLDAPDTAASLTSWGVYDRSGWGNWGAVTSSPVPVRGRIGQAIQFDGANDYVDMGDINTFDGLTTTTWSAWIKTTGTGEEHFIDKSFCGGTSGDGPVDFGVNFGGANGKLSVYLANGSTVSGVVEGASAVNDGEWHMATFTYDGSTILIYVDGKLETTTAWAGGALSSTTNAVQIGGDCNGHGGLYWNGTIDEARVYNRVLSAAEIKSLYDRSAPDKTNTSVSTPQGTGRLDSGLAGYWKLDEGTGTSVADASTAGNTGTLTNGPTWTTGQIGGAVNFDGTNDYASFSTYLPRRGSVSAWVDTTEAMSTCFESDIFSAAVPGSHITLMFNSCSVGFNKWMFLYRGSYGTYADVSGPTYTSTSQYQGWHHLTATWDDATGAKLYIDGVLAGSSTTTTGAIDDATAATGYLGSEDSTTDYYSGKIDEVRLYERILSSDEVADLYRLSAPTGTDTGLKGYWSFNGQDMNATTAYDRSGAGNDGTLTNGAVVGRGKLGQAVQFDGTNDYVNAGSASIIDDMTQLTACVWMNASAAPTSYGDLVGKVTTTGWAFEVYNSGSGINPAFFRDFSTQDGNWIASSTILDTGTWYHLCATYDKSSTANDPALYVNGTSVTITESSTPIGTAVTDAAASLEMGSVDGTIDQYTGKLDEVRVYNRILSSSEIQALYNSGR